MVGSGDADLCDPLCNGTSVTRFIDLNGDYRHTYEGCNGPLPITWPQQEFAVLSSGSLLDTSMADIDGIVFDIP